MSCLYLDRRGLTLKSEGNVLVVMGESTDGNRAGNRISTIPLSLISRICIKGSTQLSASLLAKLGALDIAVLILQGLQQKPVMMLPSFRQDALRRQVQLYLSQDSMFCLEFAKTQVFRKVNAQLQHLQACADKAGHYQDLLSVLMSKQHDLRENLTRVENLESLLGFEGAAANYYFRELAQFIPASLTFKGRNKRPPKDPFNVVLSLGYTLIHQYWVREIYMMGLDPYIGFYHQVNFGRESLASDLMETLRPLYDQWALECFNNGVLRKEDFVMKGDRCEMGKAGRLRFYEAYEVFLESKKSLIKAEKQLLFSLIQQKIPQWKQALNLGSFHNIFESTSLIEQRIS